MHKAAHTMLLITAVVLAYPPANWLIGTWTAPGYDGLGWIPALLVVLLLLWSVSSPRQGGVDARVGIWIVVGSAVLRLCAQLLDINVLGALLLTLDVYGVAALLGTSRRQRALSPFWLAVLMGFSLPLEPMLQRVLGYGLQHVSAGLACAMLTPVLSNLACEGLRMSVGQIDVLVDLPCSGTRLLTWLGLLFSILGAFYRPGLKASLVGIGLFIMLALLTNAVRIVLLASGLVNAHLLPFSVMDPLPHELIGLALVAVAGFLMLCSARLWLARPRPCEPLPSRRLSLPHLLTGLCLLPLALFVGAIKPQPLDAVAQQPPPILPEVVAGFLKREITLSALEQRYFTTYGGAAARAHYGPYGLLLVTTASPLRHLHDPVVCWTAQGYDVALVGTDHDRQDVVYSARDPAGREFILRVAYRSSRGERASSISEVVWRWLGQPTTWQMIQRIMPLSSDQGNEGYPAAHTWDASVRRAFNLQSSS